MKWLWDWRNEDTLPLGSIPSGLPYGVHFVPLTVILMMVRNLYMTCLLNPCWHLHVFHNQQGRTGGKLPMLGLLRGNMPTQCMEIDWIFKGSLKCQIFTLLISEFEHLTSFNWYYVITTIRSISTSLCPLGEPKRICGHFAGLLRVSPEGNDQQCENWIQRLMRKKLKSMDCACLKRRVLMIQPPS